MYRFDIYIHTYIYIYIYIYVLCDHRTLDKILSVSKRSLYSCISHAHTQRHYTELDDSRAAPLNEENTTDETLKTVLLQNLYFYSSLCSCYNQVDELTNDINQIEQYTEKLAHNHTTILSSFQNERTLPNRSKNTMSIFYC